MFLESLRSVDRIANSYLAFSGETTNPGSFCDDFKLAEPKRKKRPHLLRAFQQLLAPGESAKE
jgi:hypothetical protein